MKKSRLLLTLLLMAAMTVSAQQTTVKVTFTGGTATGQYCPFTVVTATNVTRNWTEYLIYPDTVLVMTPTGVDEHQGQGFRLGTAYPNPFNGETRVPLELSEAGEVLLQAIRSDGSVVATRNMRLEAGTHHVAVRLADPGLAFLTITTSQGRSLAKLVSTGKGGVNDIDVQTVSTDFVRGDEPTRGNALGEFVLGDVMRYEAMFAAGGVTVQSTAVTQQQYVSETVTLRFAVSLATVTTNEVTDVTQTSAICGGNASFGGGLAITDKGVCWSTNQNPTIADSHTVNGTGTGSFMAQMNGLTAGQTYFVRAYATNALGTAYGTQKTFTTTQAPPGIVLPTVTTSEVANITETTAICGGTVTGNGNGTVTERGVCWSTSPNPTLNDSHLSNGSGMGSYLATLTGLTAGQTYYVRAYATNEAGTAYGEMKTFTTTGAPPAVEVPTVTTGAVTNITSTQATFSGTVTDDGGADVDMRGFCYGTSHNPTWSDSFTFDGTGMGSFTRTIEQLTPGTTYYVRAYARNSAGTAYGNEVSFTTLGGGGGVTLPTVTTSDVTNITSSTATCGGNVTSDGGASVVARGVCWSLTHNPTLDNSHTTDGTGIGTFTSEISGMLSEKVYYVRAYARNSEGTAYGNEVVFATLPEQPTIPEGAIDAQFSVSASDQVYFSRGNLQYQASTDTWKFAEHQYDYIGNDNENISATYSGWIDLFGWGTSGYHDSNDPYNTNYQPWSSSMNMVNSTYNYYGYGPSANMSSLDLTENSAEYDWGVHNAISNGGNTAGLWRTMTDNEWLYLLYERSTSTVNGVANARYAKAEVADEKGLILFPDTYTHPVNVVQPVGVNDDENTGWNGNSYSAADWALMEQAGCVFLPAAGYRRVNVVERPGLFGSYMSVTHSGIDNFHSIDFVSSEINDNVDGRFYGISVRLVHGVGTNTSVNTPTVSTSDVTNVTMTEATCGGIVINDNGYPVTARGVCWSEYWNPDLSDEHTVDGSGTGSFTSQITGLAPGTTYNVRAYATNSEGTSYGMNMTFTTEAAMPEGAIDGLFTINNSGDQVYFSQGNLQYNKGTQVWSFMEHQYDMVETQGQDVGDNYANQNIVSLFGWGTSGYNCGNTYYQPWNTGGTGDQYGPVGEYDLTGSYAHCDWGVHNPISNGGNTAGLWRTLTIDEWSYVFFQRTTSSGNRFAKAQVNGVGGVILLPDEWSGSYYSLNNTNESEASYDSNIINASQWDSMEQHGAVFLPAAGKRWDAYVYEVGDGYYWSASNYSSSGALEMIFTNTGITGSPGNRLNGWSVRLVRPAQ